MCFSPQETFRNAQYLSRRNMKGIKYYKRSRRGKGRKRGVQAIRIDKTTITNSHRSFSHLVLENTIRHYHQCKWQINQSMTGTPLYLCHSIHCAYLLTQSCKFVCQLGACPRDCKVLSIPFNDCTSMNHKI